jgi:hypothetical protein
LWNGSVSSLTSKIVWILLHLSPQISSQFSKYGKCKHLLRFGIPHYAAGSISSEVEHILSYRCFCFRQPETRKVMRALIEDTSFQSRFCPNMLNISSEICRHNYFVKLWPEEICVSCLVMNWIMVMWWCFRSWWRRWIDFIRKLCWNLLF